MSKFNINEMVGFKSDIEQCGVIVKFLPRGMVLLRAVDDMGFDGEYIGGEMETEERIADLWKIGEVIEEDEL